MAISIVDAFGAIIAIINEQLHPCYTYSSEVRGHGHAARNLTTFFNSKSGNCLARRFQWLKTTPRFSNTLIPTIIMKFSG